MGFAQLGSEIHQARQFALELGEIADLQIKIAGGDALAKFDGCGVILVVNRIDLVEEFAFGGRGKMLLVNPAIEGGPFRFEKGPLVWIALAGKRKQMVIEF